MASGPPRSWRMCEGAGLDAASEAGTVKRPDGGFSRSIDIGRLERETRPFLAVGLVIGIIAGAAFSRYVTYGYVAVPVTVAERKKPIRVDLIEIPRKTVFVRPTASSPRPSSPSIPRVIEKPPPPVTQPDMASVMTGIGPVATSRSVVPDVAEKAPAMGDTAALSRQRQLHRKVPIEEREREMARLKKKYDPRRSARAWTVFEAEKSPASQDFTRFGVPFTVPNPFAKKTPKPSSARHAVLASDSLGNASRTTPEQALLEKLRADDFRSLSEPDVRFLIVMWRDTYFDESRLSLSDWAFLTKSGLGGNFTSAAYLKSMEERGLVKQVAMNGGTYFRTQLSREELLKALERNSAQFSDSTRSAEWSNLVSLVGSCYDFNRRKVILPE